MNLCRELLLKQFFIFKWIMMLCKWHCTGIEPAVDNFRYTLHGLAAVRAGEGHSIDIWTVKFYLCGLWITDYALQVPHGFRCIPDVRTHIPRSLSGVPQ